MPNSASVSKRLHPIDRYGGEWSEKDLDRFMVFLILDRATSYTKVCDAFDALDEDGISYRWGLVARAYILGRKDLLEQRLIGLLRGVGYRFPNVGAKNVLRFMDNVLNLKTASRDEIVDGIHGVGMKLASMFVRNTRKEQVAVIDTHIRRWLDANGCEAKNYKDREAFFLSYCRKHELDPYEFDMEIWNRYRR